MADHSSIEWTDATWNPIRGVRGKWSCTKVSPGCANCYAERLNVRFGGPRYVAGADKLRLDEEVLEQPLRWRRPRRVFVCSMTDVFEERVKDEWIDAVLAVAVCSPSHTFQILTKRPARALAYMTTAEGRIRSDLQRRIEKAYELKTGTSLTVWAEPGSLITRWPLPNVWLGVSVEDQARADERIPLLLETPAAVRFLSVEPLLSEVKLRRYFSICESDNCPHTFYDCRTGDTMVDWVIVGGESGPGARPMDLAWARSTVKQCRAAGIPVFVKQLGARPVSVGPACKIDCECALHFGLRDRKGGDPSEWPEDLRVREFPQS